MTDGKRGETRRRAEAPDDAAFRLLLFRETHGAILAGLDPALADTLLRQQMAGQAMTYAAVYPGARHEIVEADGAPIGRIVTARSAEAFTLVDIALLTSHRGRGIGTALLRELLGEAVSAARPVRLNVRAGNPARRLYERLGFRVSAAGATAIETDVAMAWHGEWATDRPR